MKHLFVALICVNCAILSVNANDKIISIYQLEPFDQRVSTELVATLTQSSDITQSQEKILRHPELGTVCEIKQAKLLFQDEIIPFTPVVREVFFENLAYYTDPAYIMMRNESSFKTMEDFRLLNLQYGYRLR